MSWKKHAGKDVFNMLVPKPKLTKEKTSVSGSQFLDKLSEIKNRPVKTETFKPKKRGTPSR